MCTGVAQRYKVAGVVQRYTGLVVVQFCTGPGVILLSIVYIYTGVVQKYNGYMGSTGVHVVQEYYSGSKYNSRCTGVIQWY
jgi:hypothetical protein